MEPFQAEREEEGEARGEAAAWGLEPEWPGGAWVEMATPLPLAWPHGLCARQGRL